MLIVPCLYFFNTINCLRLIEIQNSCVTLTKVHDSNSTSTQVFHLVKFCSHTKNFWQSDLVNESVFTARLENIK